MPISDVDTTTCEGALDLISTAPGAEKPSAQRSQDGPDNGRCPVTGQFARGNTFALQHGGRSQRHVERLKDQARDAIAEQREQIVTDLGGADALSRIQADLVERYVTASCLLAWMESELVEKGPLTAKGTRRALHTAYATQLDRCVKLAGMLGLDRKAAPLPSLEQYMAEKERERERDEGAGDGARPAPSPASAGAAPGRSENRRPRSRASVGDRRAGAAVPLPGIGHDNEGIPEHELHDAGKP